MGTPTSPPLVGLKPMIGLDTMFSDHAGRYLRMGVYGSCPVLVATSAHQVRVLEGVFWMGLLILVIIVGVGVAAWVRQRAKASQRRRLDAFTLEELRRLRNRGTVTQNEYDTLRDRVVTDLQQTVDGDR